VDWIDLPQSWDSWWDVTCAGMDLWVPYNVGKFLTSLGLSLMDRVIELMSEVLFLCSYFTF